MLVRTGQKEVTVKAALEVASDPPELLVRSGFIPKGMRPRMSGHGLFFSGRF